jgi:hypothetical protein
MIPFFPTETLQSIVELVTAPKDLASLCSTSELFLELARPVLYRTVRIGMVPNWMDITHQLASYTQSTRDLVYTLKRHSHLLQFVRALVFEDADADDYADVEDPEEEALSQLALADETFSDMPTFAAFVDTIPDLQDIVLNNPLHLRRVDNLLSIFQTQRLASLTR